MRYNLAGYKFRHRQQRRLKPPIITRPRKRAPCVTHARLKRNAVNDPRNVCATPKFGVRELYGTRQDPQSMGAPRVNIWSNSVPGPPLSPLPIDYSLFIQTFLLFRDSAFLFHYLW